MKRNIAFFISSNKQTKNFNNAKTFFLNLANKFNYLFEEFIIGDFIIGIIFEEEVKINKSENFIEFPIGNMGNQALEKDRFLKIKIFNSTIEIENDYAGSIPVYFSLRDYISLSNIESFTVLDSGSSIKDFSYENIYGFMHFMHFIWDETAYKHIFTVLPDSLYKFNAKSLLFNSSYLKTVQYSDKYLNLSDNQVATKLNNLNDDLVYKALEKFDQIILPLSSGYDSRMILSALSKREDLKEKLYCFTYGSIGSVEVEAGRRLTKELGVKWDFIDLPSKFLTKKYLYEIHDIFGSSMHMHGMYQLEFFNEISKKIDIKENVCLTSGFMTGVPAGQHNSLLGIENNKNLSEKMNAFPQSGYWSEEALNKIKIFKNKNYIKKVNERFKKAFDRFDGAKYQKSVIFDIWTRQRNFIGYYPRTLEWKIPTISPHMNRDYANFFMSISKKHLDDRLAVELMFSHNYPRLASIVSNSNGLKSINNSFENFMFFISRVFRKFRISFMLPKKYINNSFEFDIPSLRYSKKEGLSPLLDNEKEVNRFIYSIIPYDVIEGFYNKAYNGDDKSYQQLTALQSIAISILKMKNSDES